MYIRRLSDNKSQRGATDLSLVLMAFGAVVVVSVVVQLNSCVRDYNRKRHGWVEVPADYPYDRYQPERTRGGHIDDY